MLLSRSAAGRWFGYSRKTIQNYCKRYPRIVDIEENKVRVPLLEVIIAVHKQQHKRGFPLGGSRPQRHLKLGDKKTRGRPFRKRLEIIQRELQAMTREEQMCLAKFPELICDAVHPEVFKTALYTVVSQVTTRVAAASSPKP